MILLLKMLNLYEILLKLIYGHNEKDVFTTVEQDDTGRGERIIYVG